jgi:hypothetical protein
MHRTLLTVALALLGTIGTSLTTVPASAAPPSIGNAIPAHYISNYDLRAKPCADFTSPTFTTWNTYAEATVGHDWFVRSSAKKNCGLAAQTAHKVISSVLANDGTPDNNQINMQTYALLVGNHSSAVPSPALTVKKGTTPKGFRCFGLPSQWGESSWMVAQLMGIGVPNTAAFSQASGVAAGAGFCVSGAKLVKATHSFKGGTFFAWLPNPQDCVHAYRIQQKDDPNFPGQTIDVSPHDAQLWGTYDQVGCP